MIFSLFGRLTITLEFLSLMDESIKKKLNDCLKEATSIIKDASDGDIPALLGNSLVDEFLKSIALPKEASDQTIYDFLLQNKHRLTLLSSIHHVIPLLINNNLPQTSPTEWMISPF